MRRSEDGRHEAEGGTAIVGTIVGFAIFMILLLAAVQTLVHLYATSSVTAAANEAAEQVASQGGSPQGIPVAQAEAVARLGPFGSRHTHFRWLQVNGQVVVVRVTAQSPALLPLPRSYRDITRTVTVRTERFR